MCADRQTDTDTYTHYNIYQSSIFLSTLNRFMKSLANIVFTTAFHGPEKSA